MRRPSRKLFRESRTHFVCVVLALVSVLTIVSPLQAQTSPEFDSVVIDSLDPTAWNGIVFLAKAFQQPASFALRLGSRGKKYLVGNDIFDAVREVGPHAPDASYCRVAWTQPPRETPVKLEWAKVNRTTVVGRLTAAKDIQLVLETYFPFKQSKIADQGQFSLTESNDAIIGERFFDNVFGQSAQFVVMVDQPTIGSGTFADSQQIRDSMNATGRLVSRLVHRTQSYLY